MVVRKTLAYCNTATITIIKNFKVQAPGSQITVKGTTVKNFIGQF
jgi:uncharacterized Zn ribbon protein